MSVEDLEIESIAVAGSKGGEKKQHVPVESPDSLRSIAKVKLLLALGEGEFAGTPTAQDIYLDDTPLADSNNSPNFPNVRWEYRSGSVDQEYIKGIPSVENEFGLNNEIKFGTPYIRAISDTQLSAVRIRLRWPLMYEQLSNGDTVGSSVSYAIDVSTDGGPYVEMLQDTATGKTTNGYERSRRVDLPTATSGWQVRVRRLTPDSTSSMHINAMNIVGFTEVIDAKLRYPNTALLYVEFDSAQFQNTPKVSVRIKGREWPVPSNYDPETRTYMGAWDGTFKQAWTDNPVWIGYGIMVHPRFGLGKRIKANNIDKWELYRISQYCDDLVSDGKGGLEPRFTCNMYIQSRAEAWTVLRDIAAIYRGMVYWSQSQMTSISDMPRNVDYIFSRSNVIDGKFVYAGGSERDVYTRAIVSYDNPNNMYESDTTAVGDIDLQRRYGDNLLELTAIGCTSQSEAQRRGKWAIYTNSKNRTVSFSVGLDGNIPLPGYIIGVADPLLAGRSLGGRITSAISDTQIELDRKSSAKIGDLLYVNLPSGKSESRTINAVTEDGKKVGISVKFSETPQPEAQWSVDSQDLAIQQFRVTRVTKEEPHIISIEAVYHDPNKYDYVDNGARREERPITVIPPGVQSPPTNIAITSSTIVEQTMAVTTMTIGWEAPVNASYYSVEWRIDDRDWVRIPRVNGTSIDIKGVYSGSYVARVRAFNVIDVPSVFVTSPAVTIVGKEGAPPTPVNLTATGKVFGIDLSWAFPQAALDTNYTEIEYSTQSNGSNALLLGTFAYPLNTYTMTGLAAGVRFFFRARLVDKTGNIGEWTTWVDGTASADATIILDYIVGQITETQLGQELLTEIDKISGDGEGSVNERLTALSDEINQQITELTDALLYDPELTYVVNDVVRFGKRLYQAITNVPVSSPPPNPVYWLDIGQVVQDANGLAAQVSQNTADISEIDGVLTSQASSFDALRAAVRPKRADGEKADALDGWYSQASFSQQVVVQATENEASVERDTLLQASVASTDARLTIEEQTRATADGALASQLTTVTATANNASASASTALTATNTISGGLATMYSVKLGINNNGQYYAAGMGIGIENTPAGLQSQVLFVADRFAILNQINGTTTSPFVVQGGQTIINSAVIGDATIGFAKINDDVQSTNYIAGVQGWRLQKSGVFEINGSVPGEGRMVINNNAVSVFDANGVLRVKLGKLT